MDKVKMERTLTAIIFQYIQTYGLLYGILAGVVAIIRSAYEEERRDKRVWDAALCSVIGCVVYNFPYMEAEFAAHPTLAVVLSIVVGVLGADFIITFIREDIGAALKKLNPIAILSAIRRKS